MVQIGSYQIVQKYIWTKAVSTHKLQRIKRTVTIISMDDKSVVLVKKTHRSMT